MDGYYHIRQQISDLRDGQPTQSIPVVILELSPMYPSNNKYNPSTVYSAEKIRQVLLELNTEDYVEAVNKTVELAHVDASGFRSTTPDFARTRLSIF